ncbi:hypothetical protein GYMLUDRAFT_251086 [Collybiopsis luxurians FD-317 M1]|uniref:Uncharacterized protein n=1 Tax=Collybiopsis luxurians FD-317 M1 TaxID=944289 RepID=A0A0D0BSK6_9AGAR|nr:hypothetical protein GYMLUDRAFT_251086 [Collybiopsis luxurians FD-317 M1]
MWLHFAHLSRHVLLLGTADGHLQLWDYIEKRLALESIRKPLVHSIPDAAPPQVLSVNVFPHHVPLGGHAKIVVSFANHFIWMGTLKGDGELKAKFLVTLKEGFMPKMVCFEPSNSNIIVFSMKGRNVTLVDSQTGNTVWRKTDAPDYMGSVSLDGPCTKFIASTPQGFEVYNLQKMTPLKRPKQQPVLLSIPKQVCFDEENTKIIGGTDRGCAEVIDVKSGKVKHKLVYHQGGLVQLIVICPNSECLLVAIAGANGNQPSDVILWSKNRRLRGTEPASSQDLDIFHLDIPKKYFRVGAYIILGMMVFVGYGIFILYSSEIIWYYVCHERFNLCHVNLSAQPSTLDLLMQPIATALPMASDNPSAPKALVQSVIYI